jgi:nitrite reductase (NADH) small subunit
MSQWVDVCSVDDLVPEAGICTLVSDHQVAVFYFPLTNELYAIDNYDPFSQTYSLSRGLVGDVKGEPMVAAPVYKQHFSLKTGRCLVDDTVRVGSYPVRIVNDRVEVSIPE